MSDPFLKKKLRDFGLLLGFGFPILIGWIIPGISGHLFRIWTLWIGIPFLILGILRPNLLFLPYNLWMKLGHILGWVNSRIILGIIFLLVVQPIALIMRTFGYDPLRKRTNQKKTYRENKNNEIDLTRIFKK